MGGERSEYICRPPPEADLGTTGRRVFLCLRSSRLSCLSSRHRLFFFCKNFMLHSSFSGSFKNYRAALRTAVQPTLPYLGIYLTDLTFIEEGNKNEIGSGMINWNKVRFFFCLFVVVLLSLGSDRKLELCFPPEGRCRDLVANILHLIP